MNRSIVAATNISSRIHAATGAVGATLFLPARLCGRRRGGRDIAARNKPMAGRRARNMESAVPSKRISAVMLAALCSAFPTEKIEANDAVIGIVAPLSGSVRALGEQVRTGALKAVENAGARASVHDDGCNAEGGEESAKQLVSAGAAIVVGYLCADSIENALPILSAAGIPVITPGVRTDSLTDRRSRTNWLVFRTAPRAGAERAAVSDILIRRWSDQLFAIVDDGTIYGRELAENFRLAAGQAGLKPVFTDTYRPRFDNQIGLAGRLKNAGATHVFVGGNRDDIAIIARDADVIGYPLVIAGGEALRAAPGEVDLAPGTLMIGLPEPSGVAGRYALGGHSSAEIAIEAIGRAGAGSLPEILSARTFHTAAGPIEFDARGDRTDNPYRLFRYDGETFVEVR